ncbi:MAG TPA: DUF4349 domain-containing protein, partial [Chloroflexota bacterium]
PSTGHATTGQAMAVTVPAQQGGAPSQAVRAVGAPVAGAAAAIGAPVVNQSVPLPSLPSDQMLIRTGQIELEAKDPSALVDQVRQIAASASAGSDVGYVADERLQSNDGAYTATITINVPASTFATIMQALRGLGSRVVNETSSSQAVTEQFVDVDAQLQALHATQAQLMQLLGKTQQVSDTLSVQRELSNVDSQINQLEGRENYLKAHSAFSTIAVTIHPPATATTASTALWNPLHSLLSAIAVLGAVAQGAVDAAIWLLVFGVPLAAVALIGLAIQRGVARTLRARRAPTT